MNCSGVEVERSMRRKYLEVLEFVHCIVPVIVPVIVLYITVICQKAAFCYQYIDQPDVLPLSSQ